MSITFETSDGTRLNVDTAGEGMPVVFLHGLCGDAGQTSEAFPTEPGYRRVTIEARGHGRSQSGGLDRLSIETFANDVAAYVEANLDVPVIIGGISMGAAISLRLAVKRPDLVRALVLARPAWLTASAPENMIPNAEVGPLLTHLPPPAAKAFPGRSPRAASCGGRAGQSGLAHRLFRAGTHRGHGRAPHRRFQGRPGSHGGRSRPHRRPDARHRP